MYVEFCVEWFDLEGDLMGGMYYDTFGEAMQDFNGSIPEGAAKVTIERIEHKGSEE